MDPDAWLAKAASGRKRKRARAFLDRYPPGDFLGSGAYKSVYTCGEDLAIALCEDGRALAQELKMLKKLRRLGVPVIIVVDSITRGAAAMVMEKITPPSETLGKHGNVYWGELSADHQEILQYQAREIRERLRGYFVGDIQCMINNHWGIVLHDPLSLRKVKGCSISHLRCNSLASSIEL